MSLTDKQNMFVKEYLIDLNATQAAIRAGYSKKTARKIGNENLTKPDIQAAIEKAMADRSKRTEITADRVLQEYAKIAFSDITDYLKINTAERVVDYKKVEDEDGNVRKEPVFGLVQAVELFDTDNVDGEKMLAVSSVKQSEFGIELKLHDKKGALDSLARHLGMFKDKMEHSGFVGVQIIDDLGDGDDSPQG
ncbi:terminase small subunit [Paenibacillus polymyxa]|uniref:terminase small subunit n=1 Tax=Paenibacillus polymyxa TaxID=1406 RepID=UPI0008FB63B3|nr:terminase small subunit [Paenibacillus polymyxa]APB77396.1 terminase small subunit [Paenibacillus polymyxa]